MTRPDLPAGFDAALAALIKVETKRVSKFMVDDEAFWIKRLENLSLRYRIQKGSGASAFQAERNALHHLTDLGMPVPAILAESDDYFVVADAGRNLVSVCYDENLPQDIRTQAFCQSARALAQFHNTGLSHGRPAVRDFCWTDGKVTLIDLERYAEKRNTPKGHVWDLLIFVHSALVAFKGPSDPLKAAIQCYQAEDQNGVWQGAADFCRRNRWMDWVTKPIQWRGPGKAREFKAVPQLFDVFEKRAGP